MRNYIKNITIITLTILVNTNAYSEPLCREIIQLPYSITQPGDYCLIKALRGNFQHARAITISSDNAILDLRGFSITNIGNPQESVGIFSDDYKNVIIRNGALNGFDTGIKSQASTGRAAFVLIEAMRIYKAKINGISLEASFSEIRNNTIATPLNSISNFFTSISIGRLNGLHSVRVINNVINSTDSYSGISFYNATDVFAVGNRMTGPLQAMGSTVTPEDRIGKVQLNVSDSHSYNLPGNAWEVKPNF